MASGDGRPARSGRRRGAQAGGGEGLEQRAEPRHAVDGAGRDHEERGQQGAILPTPPNEGVRSAAGRPGGRWSGGDARGSSTLGLPRGNRMEDEWMRMGGGWNISPQRPNPPKPPNVCPKVLKHSIDKNGIRRYGAAGILLPSVVMASARRPATAANLRGRSTASSRRRAASPPPSPGNGRPPHPSGGGRSASRPSGRRGPPVQRLCVAFMAFMEDVLGVVNVHEQVLPVRPGRAERCRPAVAVENWT